MKVNPNKSAPFFSVIIPAYNAERTIEACLTSLARQSFINFEVIIVDDGSTDETANLVSKCPSFLYLQKANGGPGSARNYGCKYAQGEYFIFLDADDVLFDWTLEIYYNQIVKQNCVAFFGGNIFNFKSDEELKTVNKEEIDIVEKDCYFDAARRGIFVGSCMMGIRADIVKKSNGFNEKQHVAEDHDLTYRIGHEKGFFFIEKPFMVGYRYVKESLSRSSLRAYKGLKFLHHQYKAGNYRLTKKSALQYWYIYCQHVRANSLALKKEGYKKEGIELYKTSFFYQLYFLRIKYLIGFWIY